jgi:thioredoxin-related protein
MKTFLYFFFIFHSILLLAQKEQAAKDIANGVEWKSFEEVNKLFMNKQKPVLIFIYDEDNDSSQIMLDSVFALEEVANYVNVLYYPIKLEVNSKDTLTFFDGNKYANTNGTHNLAKKLSGGATIIPSTVIFSKEAVGTVYPGFKDRDHIFPILIYYAENTYKTTNYEDFEKYYFKTYPPGRKQIMTRVLIKWKSMEEAFELNKKVPKKIFVNIYNNYNISCTMMRLKTYNNPKIANYLNNNFYCVNIDSKTKDTIKVADQQYINEGAAHGYHQLPIAFLNGKMVFPAFLFFDDEFKFLDKKQEYMTPEEFEPIIKFVGSNAYKKQKWDAYLKSFKSEFVEE